VIRREGVVIGAALTLMFVLAAAMVVAPARTPIAASPSPSAGVAAQATTPLRTVREGVVGSVQTLDPLFARTHAEQDLVALIFSGLSTLGPNGTIVPALAERWVSTGGGKNYTFTLRRDAVWQDGVPVTADDVVFTVLTVQHPDYTGPLAGTWRGVTVKKLDARTVRFTLATQAASFLPATSQPILPAHLLQDVPIADLAASGFGQQPVGSGPYELVSLTHDGATLRRVETAGAARSPAPSSVPLDPFSWRPAEVPSGPDGFEFFFYPDAGALADAFRAGALDTASGLDPSTADSVATGGARVIRYPRTVVTVAVPNLRFGRNLFQSVHVRRALLEAIDRDAIVRGVLASGGVRADTLIPPTSWAFDQKAAGHVTFSLSSAAKELAAAGWRRTSNGWRRPGVKTPVTFELLAVDSAANPVAAQVAHQVASDWTDLGLHVNVTVLPAGALVGSKLVPGRFDATIMDINLGRDPDLYPLLASTQAVAGGSNVAGYQSATLDKLLQSSRLFASIPDRKKRLSALQVRLAQELPLLPLFFADFSYVVRDAVLGPTPNVVTQPSERFWDVLTWRVAERPAS